MNRRYLQLAPLVILVHGLLLSMTMAPSEPVLPRLEALQRFRVKIMARQPAKAVVNQELEEVPVIPPESVKAQETTLGQAEPAILPTEEVAAPVPEIKPSAAPAAPSPALDTQPHEVVDEPEATASVLPLVQQAVPLYAINPPPAYPRQARRRGLQGVVLLEVLVDRSGRVGQVELASSSGHRLLDKAAIKAVYGWSFQPGSKDGVNAEMWVSIPVRFQLE